jgi:hypothetical protein
MRRESKDLLADETGIPLTVLAEAFPGAARRTSARWTVPAGPSPPPPGGTAIAILVSAGSLFGGQRLNHELLVVVLGVFAFQGFRE